MQYFFCFSNLLVPPVSDMTMYFFGIFGKCRKLLFLVVINLTALDEL